MRLRASRPGAALAPRRPGGDPRRALLVAGVGAAAGTAAIAITSSPPALRAPIALGVVASLLLALVGDARRALLAVVILDIPLQIGLYLDYRDAPAELGAIGGFELSATTVAIACLWAMRLAESPAPVDRAGRRELWRVALPLSLYVLAAAASVGVAAEPSLSAFEVAMLAHGLLVFVYVATALRDRREILFAVTALMVGLALEGALALWVLLGGPRGSLLGLEVRVDAEGGFDRFGGTVGSPNAAAAYFGLLLVVALGMLVAPVGKGRQRMAAAALALGGLGLVLTFGRGGWLAFVVSLAVFVVLARRRGLLRVRLSPWAAACLIILALAFGGLVGDRLTSDDANAAGSRVPLLHTAGQLIRDHPVLGVGANNYIEAAAPYRTRDIAYTWNYTVHNKYALVWSETGLLGLVSFVWFLIATVLLGIRCSRLRDPALATLGLAMGAAILGHMVHMTVEILNGRGSVQGLWLLAGLVVAIAAVGAGEREGRSAPAP